MITGRTRFHFSEAFLAFHKSKFFCIFSHRSGVVLNARASLNAISGVIEPFSLRIFDSVFLETPNLSAVSVMVIDKGIR